jgi:hypothetical protein
MHIKVPDKVHATFPGNYKGGKISFILKNTYLTIFDVQVTLARLLKSNQ